jgi:hypothetical protein
MSQPLVSIIIPTHNRRDMVVRLLKSIIASTYKTIEVIVVDDASTDGTSGAIEKAFSHNKLIRVERNKTNLFAAGSRNVGTRKSKGKYLFYIDDDNVLDKHAISELVRVFEDDKKIGELGLVNLSYRDKHKVLWLVTVRDMWTSKTYLPTNLREYSGKTIWDTVDVPNAFIMRADPIKKYGISFCEKFGIMYEESDVAYRIRNVGYSIKVVRDAIIYHDVEDYMSHFTNDRKRFFVFARNRIIFHSLYSSRIQIYGILSVWIWFFMFYYWYKIMSFTGNVSPVRKILLMMEYLKGNIAGIYFVIRNEQLVYPRVT